MTHEPIRDNEAVYDEKINPLMTRIIALCKEHHLPFVACFQVTSGEEEDDNPLLVTSALVPNGAARAIFQAYEATKPKKAWHFTSMIIQKEP